MKPTAKDYERLARTVLMARDEDADELEKVFVENGEIDWIPAWRFEAITDKNDLVSMTRETLDDFRSSRLNWSEPGKMEEVNGGLYWQECQARRGQRRCELTVVDCGEFRLTYQINY